MLLTPKQKAVYVMHVRHGMRQEDIAAQLRTSQQAVSRLIVRARQRVTQFVQRCPAGAACEFLESELTARAAAAAAISN